MFDDSAARREIEAALAANDSDLAKSFVDLAQERGVGVPPELAGKVAAAVDYANSATGAAESFARGLITGEPDDVVGLAGTALGDLFVLGDIRDAVREGSRYVSGGQADELVLGLACVGIAITAGTYATFGAAAPARVGLSALKAARKTGRISARLADWIGRSLREVIDWSALRRAGASLTEPAVAVRAAREAVKVEKADGLVKLVGDVGRVQARAGTQAALDGLKIARGPADVARVAKLAEKKGSKTRAILKMLGTGALFLSVASFNLALWILRRHCRCSRIRDVDQGGGRAVGRCGVSNAGRSGGWHYPPLWRCRGLEPSRAPGLYLPGHAGLSSWLRGDRLPR